MKTFPAGLDTLLATRSFVFADLYQFALADGVTFLYYTTADADVRYNSITWSSKGAFFDALSSKSVAHWKVGLDMDSWTVQVAPAAFDPVTGATYPAKIAGQPFLAACRAGYLDGAVVDIHRAYWTSWPTTRPFVPSYVLVDVFAGRVASIDLTRSEALITVNSWLELGARAMPRNVYQAPCRHTLFDAGCTLNRAAFIGPGSVTAVANNGVFNTNLPQGQGYYSLGSLTWTSGNNNNRTMGIRYYAGGASGAITLIVPMPFAVQVGDTFNAYPGCDKQLATCINLFNNKANFGGQPFIPAVETAV